MNEIEKTIKDLEYARYLLGRPDQGDNWRANALTIAIDKAIVALQEKFDREKQVESLKNREDKNDV